MPGATISSAAVNDDFSDIAAALTDSLAADGQTTMTGPIKAAAGTAAHPSYTFAQDTASGFYQGAVGNLLLALAGALKFQFIGSDSTIRNGNTVPITVPVGAIMDWAGAAAPSGWQLCAGQVLSQATYAQLFAAIGTTYNTGGEGAGNFRLPDCRGRFTAGLDNMGGSAANRITTAGSGVDGATLGAAGGVQNQTISLAQLPVFSQTPTLSGSVTPSISGTVTPTLTGSVTPTISGTVTPTLTGSVTPTISGTVTPTLSGSVTPGITVTYDAAGLNQTNAITPVGGVSLSSGATTLTGLSNNAGALGFAGSGSFNTTSITNGSSFSGTSKTLTAASGAVNGNSFTVSQINGAVSFANSAVNGNSFTVSQINGAVSFANTAVNGSSFTVSQIDAHVSFANGPVAGSLFSVSAVTFGSGQALTTMPPTIMFNKIIFAGA